MNIVGARPQFVKAAPLSRALRRRFREVLVHTGQHYDREMSAAFFEELGIPEPDRHLEVGSGPHGRMTARMLERLEEAMVEVRPALVLVSGDTNSTLAGALAAAKLGIPLAHVEAGLRSFDMRMPEEVNRRLTDHVSDLLFCPTRAAVANLRAEGLRRGVHRTGDVMYDAIRQNLARARRRPAVVEGRSFFLATIHRQENTDHPERLSRLLGALERAPRTVVLPLHPRTRARLRASGREPGGSLRVIPPVSYLDMLQLESRARAVLTDSGGVQKEAYVLGVPCVTLRDSTEWVETLRGGANRLVGSDPARILKELTRIDERPPARWVADVYGDGRAAEAIAERIAAFLERSGRARGRLRR
jgi:UDP-N-acetylglucosamine 2-epimerase